MCSKHVEVWNKLIVKQKCCASIWLITEINILRCTVNKTSKYMFMCIPVWCGFPVDSDNETTRCGLTADCVVFHLNSLEFTRPLFMWSISDFDLQTLVPRIHTLTASQIQFPHPHARPPKKLKATFYDHVKKRAASPLSQKPQHLH